MKKPVWKSIYIAFALAFALLACVGCAAKSQFAAYDTVAVEAAAAEPAAPAAPAPMEEAAMEMEYVAAQTTAEYGAGAGGAKNKNGAQAEEGRPDYGGRKIIRTLSLELRTDAFDEHLAQLKKDVQTAGGYVQNSYVYGTKPEVAGDSGRHADLTLRIPEARADGFVNAASGYGTLISQSEDTQDVTDNYFDLETRLEVNRDTLARLRSILVETDNLADVVTLEQEIARVTLEIEELTTNLRKYDGLISYATIHIYLYEEGLKIGPAAKSSFSERVREGVAENMSAMGNFLENAAVFLIVCLPFLVPIALIALLIWWLCKRREQRDLERGMPANLVAWQKRAWRRDYKRRTKEAQSIQTPHAGEGKKDDEKQ